MTITGEGKFLSGSDGLLLLAVGAVPSYRAINGVNLLGTRPKWKKGIVGRMSSEVCDEVVSGTPAPIGNLPLKSECKVVLSESLE